jgi:hypothetical protein
MMDCQSRKEPWLLPDGQLVWYHGKAIDIVSMLDATKVELERLRNGWQICAEAIQPEQAWVLVAPQFIQEMLKGES